MSAFVPKVTISFDGVSDVDVTGDVRIADGVRCRRGRDQIRILSPAMAGDFSCVLDNRSRNYSTDNGASPYAGSLIPGRTVKLSAIGDPAFAIFAGLVDNFQNLPSKSQLSVGVPALGMPSRLVGKKVSTGLYPDITVDVAIGIILDSVGWPADQRQLAAADTTLQWFWLDDEDAFSAIQTLLLTEGPGSAFYEAGDGTLVFENRNYRTTTARSKAPVETFTDDDIWDFKPDLQYKDVINVCSVQTKERQLADSRSIVWSLPEALVLAPNELRKVIARGSDPFTSGLFDGAAGINEVQLLTSNLIGTIYFTLTGPNGIATGIIDRTEFDAAHIQAALDGSLGFGNCNCTDVSAGHVQVQFVNDYGSQPIALMTVIVTPYGDPPGTGNVVVAETTPGQLPSLVVSAGFLDSVTWDRNSGAYMELRFQAGPEGATVTRADLYGTPLAVIRTREIKSTLDTSGSQRDFGAIPFVLGCRPEIDADTALTLVNAVAGYYERPRGTAEVVIWGLPGMLARLADREISDCIQIVNYQSAINANYWIEQITVEIIDGLLRMTLGCERQHVSIVSSEDDQEVTTEDGQLIRA
jgi:hypothetical protein